MVNVPRRGASPLLEIGSPPPAALVIVNPDMVQAPPEHALQCLFGLTPAEVPVGPGPVSFPDPLVEPFFVLRLGVISNGRLDIFNGEAVEMAPNFDEEIGEPFFIIGRNSGFIGTMTLDNATLTMEGSDDAADEAIGGNVGRDGHGTLIMRNGARLSVNNPDLGNPGAGGSGLTVARSAGSGLLQLESGSTVEMLGESSAIQIGRDGAGTVMMSGESRILVQYTGPAEPSSGGNLTVGRSLSEGSSMTVDDSLVEVSSVNNAARIFVGREGSTAAHLKLTNNAQAFVDHTGPAGSGDAGVVLADGVGSTATMTVDEADLEVTSANDAARIWLGRDDSTGELTVSGASSLIRVAGGTTSSVTVGTEGVGTLTMDAQARLRIEGNGDLQIAREAEALGVVELRDGTDVEVGGIDGDVFVAADFSSFGFSEGGHGTLLVDGASLMLDASLDVDQSADLICGSPASFVGSTGSPTATVEVTNGGVIQTDLARIGTGCRLEGDGLVDAQVIADGGTVAPGTSIGTLRVADLALGGGALEIEVGGNGSGEADGIDVLVDANLDGGLILFRFVDRYLPARGDRVPFLFANAITGIETVVVDYDGAGPGLQLRLEVDAPGTLSFVAVNRARPLPPACERSGRRPPWC